MISPLAYLLEIMNVRRLALVFFFLSPFFLNQGSDVPMKLVYGVGYMTAAPVLALALCFLATKFLKPIRLSLVTIFVFGIMGQTLISIAVNAPEQLISPFWYFVHFLKMVVPIFCFLVLIKTLDFRDLGILYGFMAILGVAGFFFLIIELPFKIDLILANISWRYSYFFNDANRHACFCVIIVGMTVPIILRKYLAGQFPIGYALVCVTLIIQILASGSRSGMMSLFIVCLVSVLATRQLRIYVASALALSPVILLIAGLLLLRYASKRTEVSDILHGLTFQFALEVLKDSPLFGVGLGNILEVYTQKLEGFYIAQLVVHNTILGIASDLGVPAALFWLAFMGVPGWALVKRILADSRTFYPYVEIAALNLILVFMLTGLFLPYSLLDDFYWTWMAFPYIVWRTGNASDLLSLGFTFVRYGAEAERASPEYRVGARNVPEPNRGGATA